jgi:phage terminase small subunit
MAGLTPKREKFAQGVASGMSQADAYRSAFNVDKSTAKSVQELASRLMADVKVRSRVAELRAPVVEKVGVTLEGHLSCLADLREDARNVGQYSAAISAEIARGKAAGVYEMKVKMTGPDGGPIAVTSITPAEYRRIALEVAAKT